MNGLKEVLDMRPIAKRLVTAVVLLLVPALLGGCIVCIEDIFCDNRPPRMATLNVYVLDYFSAMPIGWATVELYERDWWHWDYLGSWQANPAGYAMLHGGYLHHDGCGGDEEEDFRVVVRASGYYTEEFEIELSYYYPYETLTFYLLPWQGREGDPEDGARALPSEDRPEGKVVVGEPDGVEEAESD